MKRATVTEQDGDSKGPHRHGPIAVQLGFGPIGREDKWKIKGQTLY
jgi:hypothetical protein